MTRSICIFYTAATLAEVNKENKKVVVIDTSEPDVNSSVEIELKLNHQATFIRYIRNLSGPNVQLNNHELKKTEVHNNYQLKLESNG